MKLKATILGTLAYTVVTFPLAVIWHVVIFQSLYNEFGYFDGEPNFLLGLASILIQGVILSSLYPYVSFRGTGLIQGLKYSLCAGAFLWTTHVLAFVAKQTVNGTLSFIAMESFYLFLQFGIYGLLLGVIYSKWAE